MILYLNGKVNGVSHYRSARPILPNTVFEMLEEGKYPSIYHKRREEIYAKGYPLKSFAFCKKKVLDKKVVKQNKKMRQERTEQYLKEKELSK